MPRDPNKDEHPALTRERVLRAAVTLADEAGIAAVTMRRLARELGVEAMSLYYHVSNKADILDGMVDSVYAEIELPSGDDWKSAMRSRADSTRQVLARHRWAVGLLDSRTGAGPATLRHHDAVIGTLRAAGFSLKMAAHAFAVLDSFIYGFVLQESSLPFADSEEFFEVAERMVQDVPPTEYPHLTEMTVDYVLQPGYCFANEFGFGLDLVLDGIERLRDA